MKYPHTIAITRTAQTISATGGVPVDGATSTIYSGEGDAQENDKKFEVQTGIVSSKGSATVFLPDGLVHSKGVATGDSVVITWPDSATTSARVESVSRLDDSFAVMYT